MTDVSRYCVECERLQAEVDQYRDLANRNAEAGQVIAAERDDLLRDYKANLQAYAEKCAEVDRMRPVYDAASKQQRKPRYGWVVTPA